MHIGINATYQLRGGGLSHLRRLLSEWSSEDVRKGHRFTIFTRKDNVPLIEDVAGEWARVRVVDSWRFSVAAKLIWEQVVFPSVLRRTRVDVVYCPGGIVPLFAAIPSVVLFQNMGPLCPSVKRSSVGMFYAVWFAAVGQMMARSARRAARCVTVSYHAREEISRHFGVPESLCDVIYHGRDGAHNDVTISRDRALSGRYALCVSHLHPHKGIRELILAVDLAKEAFRRRGLRLAIVGEPRGAAHHRELLALIRKRRLDDVVELVGGLPHDAIRDALSGCEFFVFQSTCESFGLPLLEALEAKAPICSSRASVMPEIAGEAALYFDPADPASIAESLTKMAEDGALRERLRGATGAEVAKFPTWREVAEMTVDSLEKGAGAA
jgi:glycosyltransferase involved in cell wall biosynthesis